MILKQNNLVLIRNQLIVGKPHTKKKKKKKNKNKEEEEENYSSKFFKQKQNAFISPNTHEIQQLLGQENYLDNTFSQRYCIFASMHA